MQSIILHLVRSFFPTNTAVATGQVKDWWDEQKRCSLPERAKSVL